MTSSRVALWCLLGLAVGSSAAADNFALERFENWHQWRGPNADGVAPHGDPPLMWDESTNIQWKVEIPGSGSATPIVWGRRIFMLTAIDTGETPDAGANPAAQEEPLSDQAALLGAAEAPVRRGGRQGGRGGRGAAALSTPAPTTLYRFEILCLDRDTGQVLWQRTATTEVPHEGHHPSHGYASASATTDGQLLYASFGSRGVYCYDLDGQFCWKRDLGQMESKRGFGEGASPVLHGDSLVVNWDHEGESFIVCLDAKTGDVRWRKARDESTTWATPLVVEHDGVTQVVVNATGRTRSYDVATGEVLWECGGQVDNPIPSPVARNGLVYCMTGYQGYAINAISLDSRGDVTDGPLVRWRYQAAAPYVASPLLYDNLLYFTKGDAGIVSCLDANTGEVQFGPQRLGDLGTIYASPVGAAGRVYITGRDGATVVIKHARDYQILSTNRLDDQFNASPVVVGKQLLLRGERHLYSIVGQETPSLPAR